MKQFVGVFVIVCLFAVGFAAPRHNHKSGAPYLPQNNKVDAKDLELEITRLPCIKEWEQTSDEHGQVLSKQYFDCNGHPKPSGNGGGAGGHQSHSNGGGAGHQAHSNNGGGGGGAKGGYLPRRRS